MTKNTKKSDNIADIASSADTETTSPQPKTCFVIMPIADMTNYEPNHFDRVYRHLIKPACEKAGFEPIRADEVASSNFIVMDILKKIVECDLAICDLSARNPNVLYELGLRQAFNKKTVLIKDDKTTSPFDVSAFRYFEYDSSLRIDCTLTSIGLLSKSITETYSATDDINSIVDLLQISPASIGSKTELSAETTFLLDAIASLSNKVDKVTNSNKNLVKSVMPKNMYDAMTNGITPYEHSEGIGINRPTNFFEYINTPSVYRNNDNIFIMRNGEELGNYIDTIIQDGRKIYVFKKGNTVNTVDSANINLRDILILTS